MKGRFSPYFGLSCRAQVTLQGVPSLLGSWVKAVWELLESKSTKALFPPPTGCKKLAKPSGANDRDHGPQPYSQPVGLVTSRTFCSSN